VLLCRPRNAPNFQIDALFPKSCLQTLYFGMPFFVGSIGNGAFWHPEIVCSASPPISADSLTATQRLAAISELLILAISCPN
jgi:hypothetical protein